MSEPFLGEIRLFANNYAPSGWMECNGQLLQINGNQALYSLLGSVYGGDGVTTFALPDLRGRVPIHVSPSIPLGQKAGEETHILTANEMPMHTHGVSASSVLGTNAEPEQNVWANQVGLYSTQAANAAMNAGSVSNAGSSQPHNNMQPYLAVNFYIATTGIFPSRN